MNNLFNYKPSERVRLTNGRFVDVENGCYFEPGVSVVIQNGKIASMPGLPDEPDLPVDATIDLQGKTVIPTLFNTHCHLQIIGGVMDKGELRQRQIAKNLADCIDRGVTNIRDTLCYDLRQNRTWIEKIEGGEVPGPRIHQAVHVGPIGGTYSPKPTLINRGMFNFIGMPLPDYSHPDSGVVTFRPGASTREVREAVDRAVDERGAAAIKFCDQLEHFLTYKPGANVITQSQLDAAVDQSIKRGMPTTMHNVTVAGFRMGVQAGLNSLGHVPIDGELTEQDAEMLLASSTFIEPTISVGYFMSYSMKGSQWAGHPEIVRLDGMRAAGYDELMEECWLPEFQAAQKGQYALLNTGEMKVMGFIDMSTPFRFYARLIPVGGENLRLIQRTGGVERFACGSDATVSNCGQGAIHLELEMFDFVLNQDEKPVFSPAAILRTATIQSARSMGVQDRFGSIRTGKVADLAIVDGSPLEDFHTIGKPVQALFMDGELRINRYGLKLD